MEPLTDAQRALVEQHLHLVKMIAWDRWRHLPPSIEMDDIQQAGRLGLVLAAQRYDVNASASFETFARFRIHGAISDYLRELDTVSKDQRQKIKSGEERPVGEVCLDDLFETLEPRSPVSTPEEACMALDFSEQLRSLVEGLGGRERIIVQQYYYQERKMRDIAVSIGCSEPRVSQLHKALLIKLASQAAFVERMAAFRFALTSGVMRRLGSVALAVLAAVAIAPAQTRVTPPSLAGTPGTTARVWVVLPAGTLAEAELENIQLVIENGKAILRAIPQTLPPLKSKYVLTAPRADFALSGTLDTVHRNGLLQAEGDDYTIVTVDGVNTLRFNANAVPQAKDIVQIRELK